MCVCQSCTINCCLFFLQRCPSILCPVQIFLAQDYSGPLLAPEDFSRWGFYSGLCCLGVIFFSSPTFNQIKLKTACKHTCTNALPGRKACGFPASHKIACKIVIKDWVLPIWIAGHEAPPYTHQRIIWAEWNCLSQSMAKVVQIAACPAVVNLTTTRTWPLAGLESQKHQRDQQDFQDYVLPRFKAHLHLILGWGSLNSFIPLISTQGSPF